MKNLTFAGTTLILVGISLLVLSGMFHAQSREPDALRSLRGPRSDSNKLAVLPVMGVVMLLGGVAITIVGVKRA